MRVMGRLSAAGLPPRRAGDGGRAGLLTDEGGMDHIGGLARGRARVGSHRVRHPAAEHAAAGVPVNRHHLGGRLLADHARRPHRAEGRDAEAAGREGRATTSRSRTRPPRSSTSPRSSRPPIRRSRSRARAEEGRAEAADAAAATQARAEAGLRQGAGAEGRSDRRGAEERQASRRRSRTRRPRRRSPQKKAEPPKPQPKYDATRIAALLDKRDPQRRAATGSTLEQHALARNRDRRAPSTLSQNELDALRARLRQCWNVPVGLAEARDLVVTVRIQFKQDGSLLGEPRLMNSASHPAFQAASESALRAVRSCAPYTLPSRREVRGLEGCHRRFRSA